MAPRGPDINLEPGRVRPRHLLIGVAFASLLAISSGGGASVTKTSAAQNGAPPTGHAQVIAQAVIDLDEGDHLWTVAQIEAGQEPEVLGGAGGPGFVIGAEGQSLLREGDGGRTRLAAGEALAVRPEGALTVEAAGAEEASLLLLSLEPAAPSDLGDALRAGDIFSVPGGSRDVELVADVLAEGETAAVTAGETPTFVLVTAGTLAVEVGENEIRTLQTGDTALVRGALIATGESDEPARFVAAVIGAEFDAAPGSDPDTSSQTPGGRTPAPRTSPSPRPSPTPSASPTPAASPSPTPSPSPSPSPSPTPDDNGPDDDPDGDGLVNKDEETAGTDKRDPDTDYDLLKDGDEVHQYKTSPTALDSDGDGLYDGDEVIRVGSNPAVVDTDGDNLSDGSEANEWFTNPLSVDTDADNYNDYLELLRGTDPRAIDSDADGLGDGDEVMNIHSDPLKYDTDGDGASDGYEILTTGTNPNRPDSDSDGLTDTEEAFLATDPNDYDTDGDGYSDGAEVHEHHTWPLDPESHP